MPAYAEAARAFGTAAASRGLGIVYGGGRVGLMGALADAALAGGGEVTGIIPQELVDRELAHGGLTELLVVGSLHERKAEMAKRADAFVALPGGFGTLDELYEALVLIQTGKIRHFPVVLFDSAYWSGMLDWIRSDMLADGMISPADLALLHVTDDPDDAVQRVIESYEPGSQFEPGS